MAPPARHVRARVGRAYRQLRPASKTEWSNLPPSRWRNFLTVVRTRVLSEDGELPPPEHVEAPLDAGREVLPASGDASASTCRSRGLRSVFARRTTKEPTLAEDAPRPRCAVLDDRASGGRAVQRPRASDSMTFRIMDGAGGRVSLPPRSRRLAPISIDSPLPSIGGHMDAAEPAACNLTYSECTSW